MKNLIIFICLVVSIILLGFGTTYAVSPVPCTGSIGDYVWNDLNGNGSQDDGAMAGIPGVEVQLTGTDSSGNPVSKTANTDANGFYQFIELCPGTYTVTVPTNPTGLVPTAPLSSDGNDGNGINSNNPSGTMVKLFDYNESNQTVDFGYVKLECNLILEKNCEVLAPPPGPFACSNAKPIDSITMIWNGTQNINIKAWKGQINSTELATINNIANGQEVTVSGYAGSPNDVIWEIFSATTGLKIGNSTFHLSCSDADMNGPEDCGKMEGNGKGLTGYINEWKFEGMAGNGEVLNCTPDTTGPTNECVIQLGPVPDCTTEGKPKSLTFIYTGTDCSASNNSQAADKWACSGSPGTSPVSITIVKDPNRITVSPNSGIDVGDLVTVSLKPGENDMGSEIQLNVGAQYLKIHTSCSQPLKVGDVFGSLELLAFNGQMVGNEVVYTYKITNEGAPLTDVMLSDDKLGPIAGPFDLGTDVSAEFEATAQLQQTTTNIATATGTLADGNTCSATASATITVEQPQVPFVCSEAKPIDSISMVWNGTQNIKIKAWKGAIGSTLLKEIDNIVPGQEVTVSGYAGSPNDVYWEIFLAGTPTKIGQSTFHLSCSDVDMNGSEDCGKFEGDGKGKIGFINDWLFAGMAGNGRTLDCGPVTRPPPPDIKVVGDSAGPTLDKNKLYWKLTNYGPDAAIMTKVEVLTWPSQQGKLKKIKLDGDVAADPPDIAVPPAIITVVTSDVNKKQIAAGQTRTFTIEFEKDYLMDVPTQYKFTITFEGGETLSWNIP